MKDTGGMQVYFYKLICGLSSLWKLDDTPRVAAGYLALNLKRYGGEKIKEDGEIQWRVCTMESLYQDVHCYMS
jgi:hypothetical protein